MTHVSLMIFTLFAVVIPVIAGQNQIEILAKPNSGFLELRYSNEENIVEKWKNYNVNIQPSSPFYSGCDFNSNNQKTRLPDILATWDCCFEEAKKEGQTEEYLNKIKNRQNEIANNQEYIGITQVFNDFKEGNQAKRVIPWQCFVNENDKSRYKLRHDILFSFTRKINGNDITFIVKSDTSFGERKPQDDIDAFYKNPHYVANEDKAGLIEKSILIEENGKLKHGPNGYFKQEKLPKKQKKSLYSYNWFRDCFCVIALTGIMGVGIISTPFIILYIVHKNFGPIK